MKLPPWLRHEILRTLEERLKDDLVAYASSSPFKPFFSLGGNLYRALRPNRASAALAALVGGKKELAKGIAMAQREGAMGLGPSLLSSLGGLGYRIALPRVERELATMAAIIEAERRRAILQLSPLALPVGGLMLYKHLKKKKKGD